MVSVVTESNRHQFTAALADMHADRKRVFVDLLKWDVPVVHGKFEVDQFDGPSAVYLIATDPERTKHYGSVRLLPSTEPHILGSVFPELCSDEVPVGPDVWEITRLCISPSLRRRSESMQVRRQLATAIIEWGLLHGIDRFTLVTNMSHVPALLAVGWDAEPLGLPKIVAGEMITAMAIKVSAATLAMLRSDPANRRAPVELEPTALAA